MEIRCEKCDRFTRHDAIDALLDQRKALTAERDQLRAEVERLRVRGDDFRTDMLAATLERDAATARAEAAEKEAMEYIDYRNQAVISRNAMELRLNESQAHAADLRGALEEIHKGCCLTAQDSISRADERYCIVAVTEKAAATLARTTAQSLARVEAAALREAIEEARNDEAAQESAATTRGALLCIADRLEKEAANDPH